MYQINRASATASVHILGDFNLDYQKWATLDPHHVQLVEATKNTLETNGFSQLLDGITRTWPGQADSTIDHIWSNNTQRIICTKNEVRASGDHNYITAIIRIKGQEIEHK